MKDNVTPLSKDTSLDDLGHRTHQDHWIAAATTEQRVRAEAAIIAATILRDRGAVLTGPGSVHPIDVITLADWILTGELEWKDNPE